MNYFALQSKSKSKFLPLFVIGLGIFVGISWFAKTVEGLRFYYCDYDFSLSKDMSCIDPVKNNMTTRNTPENPMDPIVCYKSTKFITVSGGSDIKQLSRNDKARSYAESEGATLEYKCTNYSGYKSYTVTCYCVNDNCKSQSGINTTDLEADTATTNPKEVGSRGNPKYCRVFSANINFLSLVSLMIFPQNT